MVTRIKEGISDSKSIFLWTKFDIQNKSIQQANIQAQAQLEQQKQGVPPNA